MREKNTTSTELRGKNYSTSSESIVGLGRYTFWHYTTLESVDNILQSQSFLVRNLDRMNDLDERDLHEEQKDFVHALCFCNSNTEKIPMWYLYAGIFGRGAAIGFTPAVFLKFLASIEKATVFDGTDKGTVLYVGTDFDIQFGWVYYRNKNEPGRVFYRNQWFIVEDYSLFERDNFFIKAYPWEYEREFRILFVNKTGRPFERIAVDIPNEICNSLKIKLAPEIDPSDARQIIQRLPGNHPLLSHDLQRSTLSVRMDLISRNYDGFLDYLKALRPK